MPYSKKQIYSTIPATTVANNNFSGRDAWATKVSEIMQAAGWKRRLAKAYSVFTTTAGPAVSAEVFMNCPTGNAGNWAIFRDFPLPKLKIFIIDKYIDTPASKMECILPGANDGTYTSIGYIETITLDGDTIHAAVIKGIKLLFPEASVEQVVGVRQALMSVNTNENFEFGIVLGTNTLTSGEQWRGGGWILRNEPSTLLTNQGLFGEDNYLEVYISGTRPELAPVNWGTQGLVVSACKEFSKLPHRNPTPVATILLNNDAIADGTPDGRYRTPYVNPKYGFITTVFANSYQIICNSEGNVTADKFYMFASALPLFDSRKFDTSNVLITELTIFSTDAGTGASGFFNQGALSGSERKAIKSPGFSKARYEVGGGAGVFQGSVQLAYQNSGRTTGNILKGIPWAGDYAPAYEPWIGWSWTGRGSIDIAIYASQPWDMMLLYDATISSNNPAQGSAADLQKFFQDGAFWKRYSKKALSGSTMQNMTVCLKVDVEL